MFNTFFLENRNFYEIIWKNKVQPHRPQMTLIIRLMNFACWVTKTTDKYTHNIKYLLLFHGSNGYANAPKYYVITLPFLYHICSDLPKIFQIVYRLVHSTDENQ